MSHSGRRSLRGGGLRRRRFACEEGAILSHPRLSAQQRAQLWRLASTRADAKDPAITSAPLAAVPKSVTVPRFSVSIYELPVK